MCNYINILFGTRAYPFIIQAYHTCRQLKPPHSRYSPYCPYVHHPVIVNTVIIQAFHKYVQNNYQQLYPVKKEHLVVNITEAQLSEHK